MSAPRVVCPDCDATSPATFNLTKPIAAAAWLAGHRTDCTQRASAAGRPIPRSNPAAESHQATA